LPDSYFSGEKMANSDWRLVDYHKPIDDEGQYPEHRIRSDNDLRDLLMSMIDGPARIVELYAPHNQCLRIGIGGNVAGVAWIKLPLIQTLLNTHPEAIVSVVFEIQGQPSALQSDELHRPEAILDLACYFYLHSRLPDALEWRRV
jgi:hypothetical protein